MVSAAAAEDDVAVGVFDHMSRKICLLSEERWSPDAVLC